MRRFNDAVAKIKLPSTKTFQPIPALRGQSSYEVAVQNGYVGTEEDYVQTLLAVDGWVEPYQTLETNKADKTDVFDKEEALSSDIKSALGLVDAATPSDAFSVLAGYNIENLVIQPIYNSMTWTVPKAKNQQFKVFCVGGGGGGGSGMNAGGGGGGNIVINDSVIVNEDAEIIIEIGAGGAKDVDGGATRFGDLIIADGGTAGGSSTDTRNGGSGGAGGGGTMSGNGGNGTFGGGGGSGSSSTSIGGSGGTDGGGHGGNGGDSKTSNNPNGTIEEFPPAIDLLFKYNEIPAMTFYDAAAGYGAGTVYGGNGGNGGTSGGGGGGFFANGGDGGNSGGGGGGGYCGNGGNGGTSGGGGGGFFANGGDGGNSGGGGGGGFFANGGDSGNSAGGNGGVLIMYIKED